MHLLFNGFNGIFTSVNCVIHVGRKTREQERGNTETSTIPQGRYAQISIYNFWLAFNWDEPTFFLIRKGGISLLNFSYLKIAKISQKRSPLTFIIIVIIISKIYKQNLPFAKLMRVPYGYFQHSNFKAYYLGRK